MKVLLVDDDDLVNKSVTRALRSRGYDIDCVYNGREAVEKVRGDGYDVVLSDIRMPGEIDGIDVAEEIGPEVHCVLMTGYYKDYDDRIRQSHRKCIYKPFNVDQIVKAIEEETHNGACAR